MSLTREEVDIVDVIVGPSKTFNDWQSDFAA
jgi:hypothetical protein